MYVIYRPATSSSQSGRKASGFPKRRASGSRRRDSTTLTSAHAIWAPYIYARARTYMYSHAEPVTARAPAPPPQPRARALAPENPNSNARARAFKFSGTSARHVCPAMEGGIPADSLRGWAFCVLYLPGLSGRPLLSGLAVWALSAYA